MQRRRYRPEERARLVAAFRASGLMQKTFAAREGITVSALQNWLYSPKAKHAREPPVGGGFVRVVGAKPVAGGGVTVRIGESVSVAFDAPPEANYLAVLLRALAC
jgi:hypothetical protein